MKNRDDQAASRFVLAWTVHVAPVGVARVPHSCGGIARFMAASVDEALPLAHDMTCVWFGWWTGCVEGLRARGL